MTITDTHQGDDCLVSVAWILRESIRRPTDLVARYGGEEFVCVLSDTDQQGALHVAETINQHIKEVAIPHETSAVSNHITLSMGVATCSPTGETGVHDLIELADQCLYQAKKQGRNRVVAASA
ncbi:MAG: diguanylate cyclase [Sedimenticola sp.]